MLKILSQGSFSQIGIKNSKNNKRNNKKKNSNNNSSMNISNNNNNFNSAFNDNNNIKNYQKYSYIMDFIDVTSKKNKTKNKNNLISSDKKANKNTEIKENINNNNKEIIENNKNIIIDNKNDKQDNNIDGNNNNKNEVDKPEENKNNVNLEIEQIQINNDNIINDDNKQNINNNDNIINIKENNQKKESNSVLIKNKYQNIPKVNLKKIKNYSSCDIRKNKGKNKLKQLNSSLDDIYINNNKKYLNIKNSKRNQKNSLYKFRQLSEEQNKMKINELTNRLNNILNLSTYNTLIKKRKIKKAGLQTSISNLENSIKLFKKNKKKKERECMKLSDEISKLITNHVIIKEKLLDYDILKQKVDIENKEIQDIKEETNNINLLTKQTQKEINEMNLNIQLLNKKIADENKLCEKIRKDIAFYKKHTDNLIQKLKIIYQNADIIEDAIINLEENNYLFKI